MVFVWNAMDFRGLGEFSTSVYQRLGKETLTLVLIPVRNQKGMFRKLGTPCENGGDECGVYGVFLFVAQEETRTASVEIEARAELRGVEERKTGMDDLKVDLDQVYRKFCSVGFVLEFDGYVAPSRICGGAGLLRTKREDRFKGAVVGWSKEVI